MVQICMRCTANIKFEDAFTWKKRRISNVFDSKAGVYVPKVIGTELRVYCLDCFKIV